LQKKEKRQTYKKKEKMRCLALQERNKGKKKCDNKFNKKHKKEVVF